MITDEKRCEVAARLRDFAEDGTPADVIYGGTECYDQMLVRVLRLIIGEGDLFERLAGLIDRPTCRNVGEDREFECSECGMIWHLLDKEDAYSEWAHVRNPPHCPSCACRVVRDAEGA